MLVLWLRKGAEVLVGAVNSCSAWPEAEWPGRIVQTKAWFGFLAISGFLLWSLMPVTQVCGALECSQEAIHSPSHTVHTLGFGAYGM